MDRHRNYLQTAAEGEQFQARILRARQETRAHGDLAVAGKNFNGSAVNKNAQSQAAIGSLHRRLFAKTAQRPSVGGVLDRFASALEAKLLGAGEVCLQLNIEKAA
jgi:hypothetical protein